MYNGSWAEITALVCTQIGIIEKQKQQMKSLTDIKFKIWYLLNMHYHIGVIEFISAMAWRYRESSWYKDAVLPVYGFHFYNPIPRKVVFIFKPCPIICAIYAHYSRVVAPCVTMSLTTTVLTMLGTGVLVPNAPMGKDLTNQRHLSVEKWHKIKIDAYISEYNRQDKTPSWSVAWSSRSYPKKVTE